MQKMSVNKSRKILSGETRQIVYNVIKCFEREKNLEELSHPLKHAGLRAATATGVSINTISKIKKEGKIAEQTNTPIPTPSVGKRGKLNKRVPIDKFDLCAIRQIIGHLYDANKQIPSIGKIHTMAKKDLGFKGSRSTMRRILKQKLGYHFIRCAQNKRLLLENNDVKARRLKYLRRIRSNDSLNEFKKTVIYLDELWIDMQNIGSTKFPDDACMVLKRDVPGQKWIFINAGYEEGFVKGAALLIKAKSKKGDKYDGMESNDFHRYVKEKLIPSLPDNCIIIMDDATYHNVETDKPPSYKHSKIEIQQWMEEHSISFDQDWTKPELLLHLQKNLPEKRYAVDKLLEEYGHEVLRVPPHCNLNPIEHIWELIEDRLLELKTELPDSKAEVLITQAMSSISKEDWVLRINHTKSTEQTYWNRDVTMENEFEDIVMNEGILSDTGDDNASSPEISMDEDEDDEPDASDDDCGEKRNTIEIEFKPTPNWHIPCSTSKKIKREESE